MVCLRFPDGSVRSYPGPVTAATVAADTAQPADVIAAQVGDRLVDLCHLLDADATLAFVRETDPQGLDILRHSTAHLLAYAVKDLFPHAQVTIGPMIENGFYYDFAFERPFTPEDLTAIERRMAELAAKNEAVVRRVLPRDEAIAVFQSQGEHYKVELIRAIPEGEIVSLYREGAFEDLCRGPHAPNTGRLRHFKLMKVAGAYWRGDHRNAMLQRIYGTAWPSKEALHQYLHMLEEAEKRDHRKLGRELDLFHQEESAPGLVFWHAKGWVLWQCVEQYMRQVYRHNGYREVKGPQILDKSLWEKTGHWDKYRENMFITESEKREYALKPMNCPGHILIYKQGVKSYRDLPLRYGEFGQCHRNEPSGGLHGIMRVRGFTQDDGHIFCTEDQIQQECAAFTALLQEVYADFGFTDILYKVATRPDKRIGSDASWDKAEQALLDSLRSCGRAFDISPGEGAFYGPKIEYTLRDALGRPWQCGTIQVDFFMPERLGAEYVGEDGARHFPVMLHRAIVGSLERFIGILIEETAGALPVWLAPVQAVILSVTDAHVAYAQQVCQALCSQGFRAETDPGKDKITYKIRAHSVQKVPYLLVVGDREVSDATVSVRARGGQNLGVMSVDELARRLALDVARKSRPIP
ncbi:threonine--tRNA ligase [Candidatus Symbiobacter mobilis]|uniref:Threonine--tRNA ligase n=1 Tax=Candidatus Symbiobacter mobilis CR TaxID=946483 RepID=U5N7S3_9BURK|nr:threonine--tRNA ligase [Candidatus Symbiobacter mobilis]AGX86254.1 threonyl-tRNA synthetase [Candidatus Symbiobacter mobilis CR]